MAMNPEYPDYPAGQDPTAQFSANLANAQTQGLPLAGALSLGGNPGASTMATGTPPTGLSGAAGTMLEQRLNTIQNYGGLGFWDKLLGGTKDYVRATRELSPLINVANIRNQQTTMQAQSLKNIEAAVEKFHGSTPDVQNQVRDTYKELLGAYAQMGGLQVPPDMIDQALSTKDFTKQIIGLFQDPAYQLNPEKAQFYQTQLGSAKTAEQRQKVLNDAEGDFTGAIHASLSQNVGQMAQAVRTQRAQAGAKGPDLAKEVTPEEIKTLLAAQLPQLANSQLAQKAFTAFVDDPKNAATLSSAGIVPGTATLAGMTEKAKIQAQGPSLSAETKDFLAMLKGPDGKPLTPAGASTEQIQWAKQTETQYQIEKSAKQGLAVEQYKRGLPAPGEEVSKYVQVKPLLEGRIVKAAPGTTLSELYSNKDLAFATPQQLDKVSALVPARASLDMMQTIAERLITAKTVPDAVAQGMRLYAGAVTGANGLAQAYLKASDASAASIARSVGTEKGVMTDTDISRWSRASIASFFMTDAGRRAQVAIMNDLHAAARAGAVGDIAGTPADIKSQVRGLLDQLDKQTAETFAKVTGAGQIVIQNPKTGAVRIGPKGAAIPQGWEAMK